MGHPYPTASPRSSGRNFSLLIIVPPRPGSIPTLPAGNIRPAPLFHFGPGRSGIPNIRPLPLFDIAPQFSALANTVLRMWAGGMWNRGTYCNNPVGDGLTGLGGGFQCIIPTSRNPFATQPAGGYASTFSTGGHRWGYPAQHPQGYFWQSSYTHRLGAGRWRQPRAVPGEAFLPPVPVNDPMYTPILQWGHQPRPALRPNSSPSNSPMTTEFPMVGYFPWPVNRPVEWPAPKPDVHPIGQPQVPPKVDGYPKPFRGKEVKLRTSLALQVFSALTEIKDALESLFDALPAEIKRKYRGNATTTLARAVWQNWREIDWGKAIWNLLVNEIEDRLIGYLQSGRQKLGQAMRDMGLDTALQPGYVAGRGSLYSSDEEYAFEQAIVRAIQNTGGRVYHRGSSIVGDYRS